MLKNFLEMVRRMEFVVLDTETTGIHNAQVVQIAIVNAFGKVLLDMLVKPSFPIPDETAKFHGISDKTVAGAPSWYDIAPLVHEIVSGREVIVYNSAYDVGVLNFSDSCWGMLETDWNKYARWHCAMLQFAAFRGIWNMNKGGYRWHKLSDACQFMKVFQSGAHQALADAESTRRLVLAMAEKPESGRE